MLNFLSGEFILKFRPNGGTAVFLRSCIITSLVYALATTLRCMLSKDGPSEPMEHDLRVVVSTTIPWIGAIFAGVYVALYARFASQWTYLSALYNQIMASSVQCSSQNEEGKRVLFLWQAAFIEDAENLHLARKPLFASLVHDMFSRDEVRKEFIKHTPNGLVRLLILDQDLSKQLKRPPNLNRELADTFCPTCGNCRAST